MTYSVRVLVEARNKDDALTIVRARLTKKEGLVVLDAYPFQKRSKRQSVLSLLFFG